MRFYVIINHQRSYRAKVVDTNIEEREKVSIKTSTCYKSGTPQQMKIDFKILAATVMTGPLSGGMGALLFVAFRLLS